MKLKILVLHRQNTAVGLYRQWHKARSLQKLGYEVTWWETDNYARNLKPKNRCDISEWPERWFQENLAKFDLLITDREIRTERLRLMAGFRHYSPGMRMIADFDDDFTCIPDWNHAVSTYNPGQEPYETTLQHFRLAEMTTTSTQALVDKFGPYCHEIRRVPNLIDPADWLDLPEDPTRAQDDHIRVLYGGAAAHYGDILVARSAIEEMIHRQPVKWRLVTFGAVPGWLYDLARKNPGKVVSLPWVPIKDYPQAIAWGGFDLALAPLADHPFNHSKSQIKWLEAAIQRVPLLASRVGPYARIPDGCAVRVENTHEEWSEALLSLLKDAELRKLYEEEAFARVMETRTLDSGLKSLQDIVEEAMSLPRIETLEQTQVPSGQPELRP